MPCKVLPTLTVVCFRGTKGYILYALIPSRKTWAHNNYIEMAILNKQSVKFLIHWSDRGQEPKWWTPVNTVIKPSGFIRYGGFLTTPTTINFSRVTLLQVISKLSLVILLCLEHGTIIKRIISNHVYVSKIMVFIF
jgi:hypothetical protein